MLRVLLPRASLLQPRLALQLKLRLTLCFRQCQAVKAMRTRVLVTSDHIKALKVLGLGL